MVDTQETIRKGGEEKRGQDEKEEGVIRGAGLVADTILCFLFYCVLIELPNRIFFPALVEMGFSGLEVLLGMHVFCILLGVGFLFRQMANNNWFLLMISLPVFYMYGKTENHYHRSIAVGMAVVSLSFAVFAPLFASKARANRMVWGHNLSLICMVSLRYAFKSALPVWSFTKAAVPDWSVKDDWSLDIVECDKYAAVLGLIAALVLYCEKKAPLPLTLPVPTLSWVLPSLAHGCLQFMSFWLYSQHSVIPRWTGMDPTFWGPIVIFFIMIGFSLSSRWSLVQSVLWWAMGAGGAYALFYEAPLPAMIGGLLLALFVASSWGITMTRLLRLGAVKGRAMAFSQLVFALGEFITVWNISYMFLDLGDAFREAPHYILFFCVFIIGLNNYLAVKPTSVPSTPIKALLIVALLFTAPCVYVRHTFGLTHPHQVEKIDGQVKVMVWNVHTGYADNGYDNYLLAARFIQDMKAGVVAILENDQARPCTGNRDQVEFLGASLGFPYHSYGVPTRESTWGCSFISLYPIKASNITVLPSPYGTKSCLIDAILDVDGNDFNLVVSHFSTEEFPDDLRQQTKAMSQLTSSKMDTPLGVLCYITSAPTSADWMRWDQKENYQTLVSTGTLQDPDPSDFDRWCQYIFYKNTQVYKYYHVDTGYMSDTEAQLADISTAPLCDAATDTCEKPQPVTADFYKYFVASRRLKHWYTGAKQSGARPFLQDN